MATAKAPLGQSETGDPLLLTPGPLTTSRSVKEAMLHDWGSRDAAFLKLNREVLEWLPGIVNASGDFVTVPMQGSGTFAVEAMLTTFVPRGAKCLSFPQVINPAAPPIRPERHIPNSIPTLRRRLTVAIARALARCPCCGRNNDQHTPLRL